MEGYPRERGAVQMTRLLVNDCLTTIPGTRTFWHDLQDWFYMKFIGGPYEHLAGIASPDLDATLIIRNATYFGPISTKVPQISLLQDIITEGPLRKMQDDVIGDHGKVVGGAAI